MTFDYRQEKRVTAIMALEALDPHDAASIAVTVLDVIAAGEPRLDPWADIRADATFWADIANPAELQVYFAAALKRLGNQALGIHSRKRLFVCLWNGFSMPDRTAFLSRVDTDGLFIREVAA